MANVFELKKNVVTYTQDKTEWKWSEHSLKNICKSEVYGSLKVKLGELTVPITKAVYYYQVLQDRKDWAKAKVVKDIIWRALDDKSRERIRTHYDLPEVRIASVNRKNTGSDNLIVAFYALNEENYYNGELSSVVPSNYKEYVKSYIDIENKNGYHIKKVLNSDGTIKTVRFNRYNCSGVYEEEHIISGYGEITFSDYMETSPKYTWLPRAIEIAKQFDITPNWQACKFSGRRGLGLTEKDAKELQVVANWYSGLADTDKADIKCDLSDKIWLHHIDGIHSIQISKREYELNKEQYQDWVETECRDFRCDLYEDENEDENEDEWN